MKNTVKVYGYDDKCYFYKKYDTKDREYKYNMYIKELKGYIQIHPRIYHLSLAEWKLKYDHYTVEQKQSTFDLYNDWNYKEPCLTD